MPNFNKVIIIGNLTRDPELTYLESGTAMAKFGIAINEKYKSGEEWKTRAIFVDVTAWAKQAESLSQYLSKGSPACIEGRLNYSTWETDDGQKRNKLDVTADRVVFLGSKDEEGRPENKKPEQKNNEDDECPF